jgi:hypothetical protein
MKCCVERAHCCCTPRHASVRDRHTDGEEKLNSDRMESRCPEGCLAPKVMNSFSLRDVACDPTGDGCLDGLTDLRSPCAKLPLKLRVLSQSSPRAPPVSLDIEMPEGRS